MSTTPPETPATETAPQEVESVIQKIDSLPDAAKSALLERISGSVGLRQLIRMVGIQSVKAGTDYEADATQRELDAIDRELYDGDPKQRNQPEDKDPMRDFFAAGPVTINPGSATETKASTPEKAPMSKPLAYGIGAALTLAALSLPIVAWNMTQKEEVSPPQLSAKFVPVPSD